MSRMIGVALLLLAVGGGAYAQPEDGPPPPPALPELPPQIAEQRDMLIRMGVDEGAAILFSVLGAATPQDMATLLPLLMIMGGEQKDKDDGDAIGGLLLMKALTGAGAAAQPVWSPDGERLYLVEDGILYRINVETMTVEGQLAYRQQGVGALLPAILAPLMAQGQEKGHQADCTDNLKQLCLAMLMYAQDHDETLPGETWRRDLLYPFSHLGNTRHFICPDRPRQFLSGYAMNRQVVGRALGTIPRPAETVLLFETAQLDDPSPVGGPEDLPEGGVHDGGVNLGFADGHVTLYPVETARRLLALPVD